MIWDRWLKCLAFFDEMGCGLLKIHLPASVATMLSLDGSSIAVRYPRVKDMRRAHTSGRGDRLPECLSGPVLDLSQIYHLYKDALLWIWPVPCFRCCRGIGIGIMSSSSVRLSSESSQDYVKIFLLREVIRIVRHASGRVSSLGVERYRGLRK